MIRGDEREDYLISYDEIMLQNVETLIGHFGSSKRTGANNVP